MKVQSNLRDKDWKAYNKYILQLKNGADRNNEAVKQRIAALEDKLLSRNQDGRDKTQRERRMRETLISKSTLMTVRPTMANGTSEKT